MRTFVIAEAACCHDGEYEKALRLIDLAATVGADACKFQYCSNPEKLAERRHAPEYLEAYRLLDLGEDWLESLAGYCWKQDIEFMCTIYLPEDVATIERYVSRNKIASFEAEDRELIGLITKPVIISLGMNAGLHKWPGSHVKYLHCVSAYPTPVEEIDLGRIGMWPYSGLSDHTTHPWTGGLAVAAGAEIIEFHMRLDDTDMTNADYEVARYPSAAKEYVANIRLAEVMLGSGRRRVMPSEEKMVRYKVHGQA